MNVNGLPLAHGDSPAFPVSIPGAGDNGWHGMSLRDWFAAQAVGAITAGLIAEQLSYGGRSFADAIAINAYEIADAMVKERVVRLGLYPMVAEDQTSEAK